MKLKQEHNTKQRYIDLLFIAGALEKSSKWGLETEVIWNAMQEYKHNPFITVKEAFEHALNTWDIQ